MFICKVNYDTDQQFWKWMMSWLTLTVDNQKKVYTWWKLYLIHKTIELIFLTGFIFVFYPNAAYKVASIGPPYSKV
jgi:hypothetical protein